MPSRIRPPTAPEIAPLEPRTLLAAQPLFDVDGLPRQLTAVGDVVYFARDTGKDSYLKYDGIIAHDVVTGAETRVARDNGKAFGDGKYRLDTDGWRLFISEAAGSDTRLWTIAPGEKRARLVRTGSAVDAATPLLIPSGSTTYIRTPNGVDALGKNEAAAHGVFSTKAFDKKREIRSVQSWQGRLVITLAKPGMNVDRLIVSNDDGSMRDLYPPVKKNETYYFDAVTVAGKNLVVSTGGSRPTLYYMGELDRGFAEMPDAADFSRWKQNGVQIRGVVGDKVVFSPQSNLYAFYRTDFTTRGTAGLRGYADLVGGSLFSIGSEIFGTTYDASLPSDPETFGPPPKDLIPLAQNYGPGPATPAAPQIQGPYGTGIVHFDFAASALVPILSVQAARGFVTIGDHAYFMARWSTALSTSNDSGGSLYVTDGTAAGTRRVTSAFNGPVVAGGKLAYTTSYDSREVTTETLDTGEIRGRISRTDIPVGPAPQQQPDDNFVSSQRWKVFLDLDQDGKRDSNEPATYADALGDFRFGGLKPTGGKKITVAIEKVVTAWTAIDGLSASVRVRAGGVSKIAFRFKDAQRSATIDGVILAVSGGTPVKKATVWLDLDCDAHHDAGEPYAITDSAGLYHFDHVTAGTYRIYSSSGQVQPRRDSYSTFNFPISVGEHVELMGST